jgi:hypothetical protein
MTLAVKPPRRAIARAVVAAKPSVARVRSAAWTILSRGPVRRPENFEQSF